MFARGSLKKLYGPELTEGETVAVCVEALYDAADDDSATGGPDLARKIYPVVLVVTADGVRRVPQGEIGAIVNAVVDARLALPDGPTGLRST
jgi:proteasome beta subunit